MYYDYFGLRQPPFKITPDTTMFFPGGNRGAVLDALIYAILNGEGIIKVVGEVGSGKTMLCRMLEKELPDNVEVVYIANPSLSPENILHAIAYDLDLAVQGDTSRLEVMNKLQEYLLAKHSNGQHVVVFVEEAQSMPVATLEEIRLLSNLETQQNKLLQLVLFGQPELDEIIGHREIRQLRERITYSFQLNPFTVDDIRDYLNARLRTCGYRSGEIFNRRAVQLIEHYSVGLVRRINILADKSLLAAFASNSNNVNGIHVKKAARDSEFVSSWRRKYWLPVILVMLVALLGVFIVWRIDSNRHNRDTTATLVNNGGPAGRTAIANPPAVAGAEPSPVETERPTPAQSLVNTNNPPAKGLQPPQAAADNPPVAKAGEQGGESKPIAGRQIRQLSDDDTGDAGKNNESSGGKTEITAESAYNGVADSNPEPASQLLGLDDIFDPGDMGTEKYTDSDLQNLRDQLEKLPPEVAFHGKLPPDEDTCKVCWSIIYRPLVKAGNL